jgi:predicted RNase H-like nuclease
LRRGAEGKGMSIQVWGILPKIREVDAAISPLLQERIVEAHPELVFATMNEGLPVAQSKKSAAGKTARIALLLHYMPEARSLLSGPRHYGATVDDLLDAAALLWSAERRLKGAGRRAPESPEVDGRGLRMEIWY